MGCIIKHPPEIGTNWTTYYLVKKEPTGLTGGTKVIMFVAK